MTLTPTPFVAAQPARDPVLDEREHGDAADGQEVQAYDDEDAEVHRAPVKLDSHAERLVNVCS